MQRRLKIANDFVQKSGETMIMISSKINVPAALKIQSCSKVNNKLRTYKCRGAQDLQH